MTLQEVLTHFRGVTGNGAQFSALCPNHDDKRQSLSISEQGGKILMNCQAGCKFDDVVWAAGLQITDLFPNQPDKPEKKPHAKIVATYSYHDADGKLLAQKLRKEDKTFSWRHAGEDGSWIWKKPPHTIPPYNLPAVLAADTVYIAEGEKDANTLNTYGKAATTGADGAGPGKWRQHYNEWFRGKAVVIFQDNDGVGKNFAIETANALKPVARSVKLIDLTRIASTTLNEHGDVSDYLDVMKKRGMAEIERLIADTPEYEAQDIPAAPDAFLSMIKTLDEYDEQEATWLVHGWIPDGQITLLAADGGIGKTTVWCNMIAAMSNGTACILDAPGTTRREMKVAFLTTEDSIRKKLKGKLRLCGAKEANIITPDFAADRDGVLNGLKIGSSEMSRFIRHFNPALCVIDPIQGFLPPKLNMGSRNEMRDCLAPLITLGEECGTTFLVLCHTNKRKGAYGRDRIADSADLWDISRSVIMAGFTEDQGIRYLSNEKNNYTQLQESILFSIDESGQVQHCGTSWKHDKEYIAGTEQATAKPKREDCKEFILQVLNEAGGSMRTAELEAKAKDYGYAYKTTERAKGDLKTAGKVEYYSTGSKKDKVWFTRIINADAFTEPGEDFVGPWNESEQTTLSPSDISA